MNISTQTTKTRTVTLSGADIIELLGNIKGFECLNESARIFFSVPSGGDYSGIDLDFKDEEAVTIEFTITE